MAHEVESMMFAGEVPWHGLGTRVPENVMSEEALRLAGLGWHVDVRNVYTIGADGKPSVEVPERRATVRRHDDKVLGTVGRYYVPVQNADALRFFDEVVGVKQAIYHTAGALDGGRIGALPTHRTEGPVRGSHRRSRGWSGHHSHSQSTFARGRIRDHV